MPQFALQISPLAKNSYFDELTAVARAELALVESSVTPDLLEIGGLSWLLVSVESHKISRLARLSWVQGIYEYIEGTFTPVNATTEFALNDDFVYGLKYKGKTSEVLSQLLVNIGIAYHADHDVSSLKLLDPMCGRGTTLMWAMRYGMKSTGVDVEPKAIDDLQRHLKKQCKLHRLKHQLDIGFVAKKNKRGDGRYLRFSCDGVATRIITADSRSLETAVGGERYDIIATDMPYGVQHTPKEQNLLLIQLFKELLESWLHTLKKTGVIVLSFNAKNPRKTAVIKVAEEMGLVVDDLGLAHRMSESIVRDVLVIRR